MQDIKKLTLVLMQSLYLNVKDGTRIYLNAVMLQNVMSKTHLVLIFDVHKFLLCLFVICINLQLFDLRQICDPFTAHMICYPVCKKRVPVKQKSSLGDTVCLIVELLRHHLVEIL